MTCAEARERLADLVRGEVNADLERGLRGHTAACPDCERLGHDFAALSRRLEAVRPQAPAPLALAVRSRVLAALEREAAPALNPGRAALAVAAGLAAVLLHGVVLGGHVDAGALSATQLAVVTALWSGLTICAFSWVLGRFRLGGADLSAAGLFALVTTGLGTLGLLLCPRQTYFALWEASSTAQSLGQALGPWASYGAFGLLYGLAPALLVAAGLGPRAVAPGWRQVLIGAATAVVLWLPATYLQCSRLGAGLLAAWAAGALAGILGGGLGGLGLRRLVAPLVQRVSP